jgi:hypothetical protein
MFLYLKCVIRRIVAVDVTLGLGFRLVHSILELKDKSLKRPALLGLRSARSYLTT